MKSYIKIYGPPVAEALKALEKIGAEMPDIARVHDETCTRPGPGPHRGESGELMGEYDFVFEWKVRSPPMEKINQLIEKIDEAFTALGCHYTITSRQ